MLYDGPATLETMRAAAPALPRGAVWAQCTTSGIEDVAEMAAFARDHGLRFYDAPVLGTRKPAEDGQLTVLAAGPPRAGTRWPRCSTRWAPAPCGPARTAPRRAPPG